MTSILILYEDDHQTKATELMNSLNNDATVQPVDANPTKIDGLTTLIFWGHGSATGLCGKTGDQILRIIKAWKAVNKNFDKVEIITCNSRHFDNEWLTEKDWKGSTVKIKPESFLKTSIAHAISGEKINNSMAKQVKRGLKYSIWPSIREIKLKSMPESVNGSFHQYSILYWEPASSSWCYVTGPTEPAMFEMGSNIKLTKRNPPDPARKWGPPRIGSFPVKVAAARIEFPAADWADVQSGYIGDLRNILVDIH